MRILALSLLVLLGACSNGLRAQDSDSAAVVAQGFVYARSVAVAPTGEVYVVDAGTDVISTFATDGSPMRQWGGTGSAEGAFIEPHDLDPTNGLTLVVADAGNSRIQRLSRNYLVLETLVLNAASARQPGGRFSSGGERVSLEGLGALRPIAVAATANDETFVLDGISGAIWHWDARRRYQRSFGGPGDQVLAFSEPVDLAHDADFLYVADAGAHAIHIYDMLGTYVRSLSVPVDGRLRSVTARNGLVISVLERDLVVYTKARRLVGRLPWDQAAPLQDVDLQGTTLWAVSAEALWRLPNWRERIQPLPSDQ